MHNRRRLRRPRHSRELGLLGAHFRVPSRQLGGPLSVVGAPGELGSGGMWWQLLRRLSFRGEGLRPREQSYLSCIASVDPGSKLVASFLCQLPLTHSICLLRSLSALLLPISTHLFLTASRADPTGPYKFSAPSVQLDLLSICDFNPAGLAPPSFARGTINKDDLVPKAKRRKSLRNRARIQALYCSWNLVCQKHI